MDIQHISRSPNEFQQPLAPNLLTSIMLNLLPAQTISQIVELKAGLFNNTYIVTDTHGTKYVLKVAPKASSQVFYNERYLMQREQSVAPYLSKASTLVPTYINFTQVNGRDAFLQTFIEGELWFDHESLLSANQKESLWYQLGQFAHSINNVHNDAYGYPHPMPQNQAWSDFIFNTVQQLIENLKTLQLPINDALEFLNIIQQHAKLMNNNIDHPKLLHGDIWSRNVLYKKRGSEVIITAVLDGERAYWGDPLSEWVFLFCDIPESFWQGYGKNLLSNASPILLNIYRGWFHIILMLEATRFHTPVAKPLANLKNCIQLLR